MKRSLLQQAANRRVYFQVSYSAAVAMDSKIRLNYSVPIRDFERARHIMFDIYGKVSRQKVIKDLYLFGLYQLAIEDNMTQADRKKFKPMSSEYKLPSNVVNASITIQGFIKILGEARVNRLYPDFFKNFNHVDINSFIAHLGSDYLDRVRYGQEKPVNIDDTFFAIINGDLANIVRGQN